MPYNPNLPLSNQKIRVTQSPIMQNFELANTYFGVDHYAFDAGANNGLHDKVTNIIIDGSTHPSTAATENKFYAMSIGDASSTLLQFSRGASDSNPTPVTSLQSSIAEITVPGSTTVDIFDATGMKDCNGLITVLNNDGGAARVRNLSFFQYVDGTGMFVSSVVRAGTVPNNILASGNKLTYQNVNGSPITHVCWTIQFFRILI